MDIWFYVISAIAVVLLFDVVRLRIKEHNMKESILKGVIGSFLSRPRIAAAIQEEATFEDFIQDLTGGDETRLGKVTKKAAEISRNRLDSIESTREKSNPQNQLKDAVIAARMQE